VPGSHRPGTTGGLDEHLGRPDSAEIAAGVFGGRSGYLSTVMHCALASSQHALDVLVIENGGTALAGR
jgi:hypothetical protein